MQKPLFFSTTYWNTTRCFPRVQDTWKGKPSEFCQDADLHQRTEIPSSFFTEMLELVVAQRGHWASTSPLEVLSPTCLQSEVKTLTKKKKTFLDPPVHFSPLILYKKKKSKMVPPLTGILYWMFISQKLLKTTTHLDRINRSKDRYTTAGQYKSNEAYGLFVSSERQIKLDHSCITWFQVTLLYQMIFQGWHWQCYLSFHHFIQLLSINLLSMLFHFIFTF